MCVLEYVLTPYISMCIFWLPQCSTGWSWAGPSGLRWISTPPTERERQLRPGHTHARNFLQPTHPGACTLIWTLYRSSHKPRQMIKKPAHTPFWGAHLAEIGLDVAAVITGKWCVALRAHRSHCPHWCVVLEEEGKLRLRRRESPFITPRCK